MQVRVRCALVAIVSLFAAPASGAQAGVLPVEFSPVDRALFAEYRVLERDRVPIIFAVHPARAASVVSNLQRRGAEVIGRKDSVGYLYAWVPIDAVESVPGIDGVQALQIASAHVRSTLSPADDRAEVTAEPRKKIPRGVSPSPSMTADNPFTGEAATQALAFKTNHPTFDGRGVVTAFVEPAAPNLHTMRGALDSSGRAVPKFIRYDLGKPVEAAAPVADGAAVWQQTDAVTADAQGAFTWRDRSYRLPADVQGSSSRWRICRRIPGVLLTGKESYDVLWAVDRKRVWVLPDSAGSNFSDAQSISLTESVPWIAIGDDASRYADSRAPHAFVFAADPKRLWLASAVTTAFHAGMVGSVMTGSHFLGSQANGIAPAAQVAIYHGGRTFNAPSLAGSEQMLAMLSDAEVDVAQASYAISDTSRFGGVPPHHFWTERLSRRNGKPFVKAMGNHGARLFSGDEFTTATNVFAVGAYTPRATWLANFGIDTQAEHTLASYSGWGPADDGGLKPDFLALTHTLSESRMRTWYWAEAPGLEPYGVSGGTSASAPNGAGHVALLVSAAKQTGTPHDDLRLRAAIATTAKFIEGVEARAQGHGLIQVSDAWTALQRAKQWQPASFKIEAPLVGAENSTLGPQRLVGRGLFELSGWRPGQAGRREITVTRTGGGAGDRRYRLRWKGDVSVFTSALRDVELPLGKSVKISVDIQVGPASGSHSAILDLIDPRVDLVAGSVLLTVMVSDPLPSNGSALQYEREASRLGDTLFFVDVPAGLSAMTVHLRKDDTPSFYFAQDPTGRVLPFNAYGSEAYRSLDIAARTARELPFTYVNPVPGVWQFSLQNREPYSMETLEAVGDWSKPMPLQVKIRGWAVAVKELPAAASPQQPRSIEFQSGAGNPDADIKAVGLGSARVADVTLTPGLKPVFFDVTVDPGATKLEVQFDHAAADAQVGLYVYRVPEGERRRSSLSGAGDDTALVYFDPSFQTRKRHAFDSPAAGRYRIALDPIRVPAGGITLAYRDTVHHPLYGSVEVTAAANSKPAQARVTVRARPEEGRRLLAEVGLFNRESPKDPTALATQAWFVETRRETPP